MSTSASTSPLATASPSAVGGRKRVASAAGIDEDDATVAREKGRFIRSLYSM